MRDAGARLEIIGPDRFLHALHQLGRHLEEGTDEVKRELSAISILEQGLKDADVEDLADAPEVGLDESSP